MLFRLTVFRKPSGVVTLRTLTRTATATATATKVKPGVFKNANVF
jgi:hypothetical protein